MTEESDPTTVREENVPSDVQRRSEAADPDLLHGGSGENEPEHQHENEPPIERKDGQVYGG